MNFPEQSYTRAELHGLAFDWVRLGIAPSLADAWEQIHQLVADGSYKIVASQPKGEAYSQAYQQHLAATPQSTPAELPPLSVEFFIDELHNHGPPTSTIIHRLGEILAVVLPTHHIRAALAM